MSSDPRTYVIWSFEHDAWWASGSWGYTPELAQAGRYSRAEADRIVANANIVAVNEVAMLLSKAESAGPPRYSVVPEHNHHGGSGWAIFDREHQRVEGGWFADRVAAERTADTLNWSRD